MISLFSEHRLIHKTLEDIYGKKPTAAQSIQYNARAAQDNVALQEQQYRETLKKNQNVQIIDARSQLQRQAAGTMPTGDNKGLGTQNPDGTWAVTPQQEIDSRNAALTNQAYSNAGSATPADPGAAQRMQQRTFAGQNQAYDPKTGTSISALDNVRNNVQAAKNDQRMKELAGINQNITVQTGTDKDGNPIFSTIKDPNYEANVQAAKNRFVQQDANDLQKKKNADAQVTGSDTGKTSSGSTTGTEASAPTPEEGMTQALLSGLPPEYQGLASYIQGQLGTMKDSLDSSTNLTKTMLNGGTANVDGQEITMPGIGKLYDSIDQKYAQMEQDIKANAQGMQGILEISQKETDDALDIQQKAAEDRLAWDAERQERDLAKKKTQQHESIVAQLALSGGFGQIAGLQEVRTSDALYEQRVSDLRREVGVQNREIIAKFSGLYVQNHQDYRDKTIANIKDLQTNLNNVSLQQISSMQARQTATQSIIKDWHAEQTTLRTTLASKNIDLAKEIMTAIRTDKADKAKVARQEYEDAWEQYKFGEEQAWKRESLDIQSSERDQARADREAERQTTLDTRRDDKERYESEKKFGELTKLMEQDTYITNYKQARVSWDGLEVGFKAWKKNNNSFADRDMIKSYEKLVEVSSVVMPGEYADIKTAAPWLNQIEGKFDRILNNKGGAGLNDQDREHLHEIGKGLYDAYKTKYDESTQRFYGALSYFNANIQNPAYKLSPSLFGLQERMLPQQRSNFDLLPGPEGGWPSTNNPFSGGGSASSGQALLSLGQGLTQGFDTPIASKANGGLYDESTVKAWGGKHDGLDIRMPQGSPLPSPIEGVVTEAKFTPGWGGTVVVKDANGAEHRFSHLSSIDVQPGMTIQRGQQFALTGGTKGAKGSGNSTGPHLDYRIWQNGKYIDPLSYHS